ncbi:mRNA turnover protein 4 homolog [Galendromus occidentalis]|uniref:Ribosome assembly factor mrt4 n=1 Tax=Galendromus occidentalis TaxID=34638 RepID=A0AAJ6VZI3_9ACAR|nr:mRNA turnover protein 4 homolog [Galendromus occidentalis]
MPVSKRNRVVSLTQAKRKGLEHKQKLVEEIRKALDQYDSVYIFSIQNMRNNKLKEVREEWKGTSKFIMGKNKVLQLALGRNAENEIADNIHKVSERLLGQCGLLLTSQPEEEVLAWFEDFREADFARAGFVATETVVLKENDLDDFPHSMEPQFRRLGLPTRLVRGKIQLTNEFTVCNEGDVLTPEMADVLKHKGIQMAEFHITLECVWKKDGSFRVLREVEGRGALEVKKSKAKHNKAKRARKSVIPQTPIQEGGSDGGEQSEDDENDDGGDDDDDEDEDEGMVVDEEQEEDKAPEKKLEKQKENRPTKKAVRKIKGQKNGDEASGGETKTDTPPRRVTRSAAKRVK